MGIVAAIDRPVGNRAVDGRVAPSHERHVVNTMIDSAIHKQRARDEVMG
jgi:hypothetical protein